MSRHFVNKEHPDLGYYEIFTGPQGARWQWLEIAKGIEYKDCGRWHPTIAGAYRDAADDWEENGDSSNRRLSGQMRAAATRAEK